MPTTRPPLLRRPTILLAVAVVTALVAAVLTLGTFGSAAAGPAVAKITAGKVKRIAARVVARKAGSLTVARARTADRLAGRDPAAYLDRVAVGTQLAAIDVPGSNVEIVPPVSITVPAGVGYVRVTGNATFAGGSQDLFMFFSADGACSSASSGAELRQYDNTTEQTAVTVDGVLPVTPGLHTYRLCATGGGSMDATRRVLVVETVAVGP